MNNRGLAPIIIILIAVIAIAAAAGGYFIYKDFANTNMKDIIYFGNSIYSGWSEDQMRADCSVKGGSFNPCGSACLDKDRLCVQVCAPRCEFNQVASKAASSTIDISSWKTYRSDKYGFEFKYPIDKFVIEERQIDFTVASFNEKMNGISLVDLTLKSKIDPDKNGICIGEFSGLPGPCPKIGIGFFILNRKFQEVVDVLKSRDYTLNNKIITDRAGIYFDIGAEGSGLTYYLVPVNEDKTIAIVMDYMNNFRISTSPELFDQILSTFKFTK